MDAGVIIQRRGLNAQSFAPKRERFVRCDSKFVHERPKRHLAAAQKITQSKTGDIFHPDVAHLASYAAHALLVSYVTIRNQQRGGPV
jgi:hypothetical protein